MQIKKIKTFNQKDLQELFASVQWKSAKEPQRLVEAFEKASHVVSVWEGEKLVGLVRSMDDGCWSANIDCLVVHKDFQKKGIGTQLLLELLKDLSKVQYINVCPDDKEILSFYEGFGFKVVDGMYLQKINQ